MYKRWFIRSKIFSAHRLVHTLSCAIQISSSRLHHGHQRPQTGSPRKLGAKGPRPTAPALLSGYKLTRRAWQGCCRGFHGRHRLSAALSWHLHGLLRMHPPTKACWPLRQRVTALTDEWSYI